MRTALAVSMLAAFVTAAPAADLFAGTWKAVPAKSTNNWGQKPPKTMTRTYTAAGGGYDIKIEGVDGEGEAVSTALQGAGSNVERAVPNPATRVVKLLGATHVRSRRVNDRTLSATYLKDDKPVGTSTSMVSADGRTLTMKLEGTSTDGKKLSGTNVYEKQ